MNDPNGSTARTHPAGHTKDSPKAPVKDPTIDGAATPDQVPGRWRILLGRAFRCLMVAAVVLTFLLIWDVGGTGVILFVVAILVTILVHELAHLLTARRYGMFCSRFFAGFGPTLFSRTRESGLEVGVKALPLGGFVTIVGMTHEQIAKLPVEQRPKAYLAQRPRHRVIVTLAGPAVNVLIGMVLFAGVGFTWGMNTGQGTIMTVADESPAAEAGLVVGDEYTARELAGNTVTFDVTGKGPVQVTLPEQASSLTAQEVGGFTVEQQTTRSPGAVLGWVGQSTWMVASGTVKAIVNLPVAVMRAFEEDRQDAAMSVVGAARYAGDVYSDTPAGAQLLLLLLASLNISIGVLNMVPILPFDGGHAGLAVLDAARARVAAWRGKPAPAALDQTRFLQVQAIVVTIFIVTTVALVIADITNPIQLN